MKTNLPASTCDSDRLESFLSGDLSQPQERELMLHLNACEPCRRALVQQAAEPAAWQEAEDLLRPTDAEDSGGEVSSVELTAGALRPSLQIQNVLAELGPTDDPRMLGRLGGYEVAGVVGAGGMGVVLKAIDQSLDRTVAIKVLAPHLAASGAARQRFAREAKAAAAVLHPNVIAIHSVASDASLPYLVMPYLRGPSLQKRLDDEGPLAVHEILRIAAQIAAGLAAAHAQGLVHRDIKPANILLEEGVERVAITDFGLARAADDATLTRSGTIAGTPQYMSPEQARGEPLDGRSDLFSLGSVLYAICTGRPPFRAETTFGVLRRITDHDPTPVGQINPDIPAWLAAIISRLMSKRAADRYASAAEVTGIFEKCLAHVQQPAAVPLPPGLVSPGERRLPRFRLMSGAIAMLGALMIAVLGAALWQATEAPHIAGQWTGDDWGQVVLKPTESGEYSGTYTDTFREVPGTIELKWSRAERRYSGKWREGEDRYGKISVRLVKGEIRGAWTTSQDSKINSGKPDLANLLWVRPGADSAVATPGIRVKLRLGGEQHSREMLEKNVGFDQLSIMGSGITGTIEGRASDNLVAVLAHRCRLESFADVGQPGKKYWDATLFVPQGPTSDGSNLQLSQERIDQMQEQGVQFWLDHHRDQLSGRLESAQPTPDENKRPTQSVLPAGVPVDPTAPAEKAKTTFATPTRLNYFTTGHSIRLACSADGRRIAVANANPTRILQQGGTSRLKGDWRATVDILDAQTGKKLVSLPLTTSEEDAAIAATERITHSEATALAFSPDGNVVAVGTSIGQVKLFDSQTGELLRTLDDKPARLADKDTPPSWQPLARAMGSVAALAFSPDGSLLATGGGTFREFSDVFDGIERLGRSDSVTGPGRLKVWEVGTGTLKHDLVGHGGQANAVAFAPDGNLLASAGNWLDSGGSGHGTGVILWNPQSGEKLRTIAGHANAGTHSLAFSPSGKMLAIGSQQYDKENDTYMTTVNVTYARSGITEWQRTFPGWAFPKAFSPDGQTLLLLKEQSIRLIDVETGGEQREITSENLSKEGRWNDFAIAPQGGLLVIGAVDGEEGSIEIWNLASPAAPAAVRP